MQAYDILFFDFSHFRQFFHIFRPLIPLSSCYKPILKLYTSYKAHMNLIQGSYELNDKNRNVWEN